MIALTYLACDARGPSRGPVVDAAVESVGDGAAETADVPAGDDAGDAMGSDGQSSDAGDAADADTFACGGTTCAASEYCYSASGGPAPQCSARPAEGCPASTKPGCSYDPGAFDGGACQEIPGPPVKACRALPASCASADPCACLCGVAAGIECMRTGREIYCGFP